MLITLKNDTQQFNDKQVYFAVYGYDQDPALYPAARWIYLTADGTFEDCEVGDDTAALYLHTIESLPMFQLQQQLWSGQILFCYGRKPRTFNVISDGLGRPTLQLPSMDSQAADADSLFNTLELTLDSSGTAWCNNTNVDAFVGPMITELIGAQSQSRGAMLPGVTRSSIFEAFENTLTFDKLVWTAPDGTLVRVYNPTMATTETTSLLPDDYFDEAVRACIATMSPSILAYNGKAYRCSFAGSVLVISLEGTEVARRDFAALLGNAHEIFGCGNAVFDGSGIDGAGADIDPVLTSALNRGLLPSNSLLPSCGVAVPYDGSMPSNVYAQLLHEFFEDGQVYAFPFDDVCGASSELADSAPEVLAVTLGEWT